LQNATNSISISSNYPIVKNKSRQVVKISNALVHEKIKVVGVEVAQLVLVITFDA